jgi:hypothetical protein
MVVSAGIAKQHRFLTCRSAGKRVQRWTKAARPGGVQAASGGVVGLRMSRRV